MGFVLSGVLSFIDRVIQCLGVVKSRFPDFLVPVTERSLDEFIEGFGRVGMLGGSEFVRSLDRGVRGSFCFCSIDSSSRSIGFIGFRLFVCGLSVFGPMGVVVVPGVGNVGACFLALKSFRDFLVSVEEANVGVRVKSVVGEYYVEDYKDDNICDELRLELENYGLTNIVSRYVDLIDFVLVDGPVYPTPPVMFLKGSDSRYVGAFRELIRRRVEIIKKLGRPVIGVVKRCEYSRKLCRVDRVVDYFRKVYSRDVGCSVEDPVIVELIARKTMGEEYYSGIVLGPFTVSYDLDYMPPKVFWYICLNTPRGYSIFRVEVLKRHYERFGEDYIESLVMWVSSNISFRGIPVGIEIPDRYSRRLTAALYKEIVNRSYGLLNLTYDESNKYASVLRELEEE